MFDLLAVSADTAHHVMQYLAAPPDPGGGEAPPGSEKILKVLKWLAWGVSAACVVGIFACAGKMALSHRRGDGGEHAQGLAMVMGACVLAGSASGIVGALI